MPSKNSTMIGEIMMNRLETVNESDSAQHAARKMRNSDVSSLLVVKDGSKAIGIITERDLVRRVCARDESSSNAIIHDIMSTPLITVDSSYPLHDAANVMIQKKVRHLLVVDENGPKGIISTSDFANYLKQNVDLDEVNAAIIQSLLEEQKEAEGSFSK
ncbi:MAG: CBS domain-containing protein [Candidatus Nitrosopolaris sp.]|jgi:signal-transduction protein with cAMP-binding, CBS, and nucleotidyltransferase domain